MLAHTNNKSFIIVVIAVVIVFAGYFIMMRPDQRNMGQKISDTVNELPNGIDKASRQMENRTPADKLSDAVNDAAKDAKENVKKATNHQ